MIGGTARGRLNVMANVIGKSVSALLYELKGHRPFPSDMKLSGDVPYHFGHVGERSYDGRTDQNDLLPQSLASRDDRRRGAGANAKPSGGFPTIEEGFGKVLCLQVHTDAAFAGQGLVAEVLQLSKLPITQPAARSIS